MGIEKKNGGKVLMSDSEESDVEIVAEILPQSRQEARAQPRLVSVGVQTNDPDEEDEPIGPFALEEILNVLLINEELRFEVRWSTGEVTTEPAWVICQDSPTLVLVFLANIAQMAFRMGAHQHGV